MSAKKLSGDEVQKGHKVQKRTSRTPVSGATRAPDKIQGNKNIRNTLKIIVIVALIVTFAARINFKEQLEKVRAIANRPVAQISIEGEFKYISKEKVRVILEKYVNQNFVDIDLKALKRGMEENPWVEKATINRVWPDKLIVKIDEQVAIARWGNNGFINQFGERVIVNENSALNSLPLLSGPDVMIKDIASRYLEVSSLFRENNLVLRGIDVDETRSWVFNFDNGKTLYVGKTGVLDKMELFLLVYDQYFGGSLEKIKKVDMRYESGLAVEWVEQQEDVPDLSAVHQKAASQKVARH